MMKYALDLVFVALWASLMAPCASAQDFAAGADVSFLQQIEDSGGVYLDEMQQPADALQILQNAGVNAIRLRLWVDPLDGYSDLDSVIDTAFRARNLGLSLLLDIHYSDSWADPGQQNKPAAWSGLEFDELVQRINSYTSEVLTELIAHDAPPAMIQIGNEITNGMLWPDGMLSPTSSLSWPAFAALVTAATDAVRASTPPGQRIDIVLHIDGGGSNTVSRWFFDNAVAAGLDFDAIGLSFYPWWHGTLSELRSNVDDLASRYSRDILIVETAYPWTLGFSDSTNNIVGLESQLLAGYPATPEGQRSFVAAVRSIIEDAPGDRGRGVYYWAPDWIATENFGSAWENAALFDFDHLPLPAMSALAPPVVLPPVVPPSTGGGGGSAFYLIFMSLFMWLRMAWKGDRRIPATR